MKKITPNASSPNASPADSLTSYFWRWLSLSVLALALVSAVPAMSADVFIDEGDSDFAPTPVSEGSKAPASEAPPELAPEVSNELSTDLDATIGELAPPVEEMPVANDASMTPESATPGPFATEAAPQVTAAPKAVKKADKKAVKKAEKKAAKKKATKAAKKAEKKADKKSNKKDKKKIAANKAKNKVSAKGAKVRKVASSGKFAGGQYAVTSRECPMESSPGAGDSVGMTKTAKKLWVEDSGNTSYWKVYGKAGNAAYVSRDCF